MPSKLTLFSQIISLIDRSSFKKLVNKHQTDYANKGLDSWTHLVSMLFCHFAKASSLRDISNGLRSATGNLNHLAIQKAPSKSSLSYQNSKRDAKLFEEFYFALLDYFGQQLKVPRTKLKIKAPIYLLNSTTISLCLSLFDWALFRTQKGAVKMHTLLDYDGGLPVYVNISNGKVADNKGAYDMPIRKGAVIVGDRFYNDFSMLNVWDSNGAFFVVRHKDNLVYKSMKERALPAKGKQHVLIDEVILLSEQSQKNYPKQLRRVAVWDEKNQQTIELLTKNFLWSADTISELYKARWTIELFFRDIKQLLHIKTFIGTSENAVKIQIWTALITILLLKVLRNLAKHKWYLSNLVSFVRINLLVKIDLFHWLDYPFHQPHSQANYGTQGSLFEK